ncbi:MAG: ATP-binding cassette domain-containing protein [Mesorhizobium sp.]|uniref:ABC transporter ATP-binding protein n=2 Tax=Mesorhizobium TaxID=68287 RepID=UPI000F75E794|nr:MULTISPECIES: ABC transporter ATP-binding protein [unclassified Mesorhizobium]RUY11674.1 ATP-binding cassette domain-containing protein [Mesorhizobium sp. M2A.F.Ca.ET.040.01.1.1]AZO36611.1 ABC transporter ATP-binding protein [Mesorhizobium sp. M2A.F.Ca.ET.046.03.2.1]RWA79378.1 MAG: ATP-binding cassette domain-containing protein [Mesorhizobium sp.]RWB36970.1 MAG: ATP-binding cassette domain-containing protein [Mesorhizobium sp.]RWE18914.1 MAG: ATP-binding cassette domain-containing protein [
MSGTQGKATGVETIGMTMRFGAFTALDDVSIKVPAGSFHALLGENGAGKSTLVKCMMGFYHPTSGDMLVDGRQVAIASPRDASALGLGMVYQHFTLVPSLTGAENLVISREKVPGVIDWRKERAALAQFMERMPFKLPLDVKVAELAAGEKQKLEIIKQLYLGRNFLVLDEPTSVLTPGEAQEVLGLVRGMTKAGDLTVLMISHKFHEVTAFADDITVLRKGRLTGTGKVSDLSHREMAAMMIGDQPIAALDSRAAPKADAEIVLKVKALKAPDRTGLKSIDIADLGVRSGEIVGIAGISGNGQKEFLEVLAGQRPRNGGEVMVRGAAYAATRAEARTLNVRLIPEEPLKNACAPRMTVAENIAFRTFDVDGNGKPVSWISAGAIKSFSARLVEQFKVKTASLSSPIASLSGGNVQRAVLARELTGEVDLLIVSNPCFGLDFSAVAEIRARIMKARNAGAAVLLMSEDLDELLELSDRILVMSDGALVYETPIAQASVQTIGEHMAGHH